MCMDDDDELSRLSFYVQLGFSFLRMTRNFRVNSPLIGIQAGHFRKYEHLVPSIHDIISTNLQE
jgi:hypothetical protein